MVDAMEDRHLELDKDRPFESPVTYEPSPRWVRVLLGGETIADSKNVLLVLEKNHTPVYYFPRGDVRMDLMTETTKHTTCPHKGEASYWSVTVGERTVQNAVWAYLEPNEGAEELRDRVAFYWHKMDNWFEEDDEVYVHPRDPYKRVDVLNSSRHVRVELNGETLAETHRPRLLFETSLPTRYYIPKLDVRMDLLTPTQTRSRCPYKGEAVYWSVTAGGKEFNDIVWSYPLPIPECPKIENLMCFFNERVDIYVDGEKQECGVTPWSK